MSIFIFSRSIRSGKTTELQQWCATQKNVAGVLMPDINGSRKIWDIATQGVFDIACAEPQNTTEPLINIGQFHFYEHAFEQANHILMVALQAKPLWLVVDEVGKLELGGKGFYQSLQQIIPYYQQTDAAGNLLLVVRDSLLEQVIQNFSIAAPNMYIVSSLHK